MKKKVKKEGLAPLEYGLYYKVDADYLIEIVTVIKGEKGTFVVCDTGYGQIPVPLFNILVGRSLGYLVFIGEV